MGRALEQLRDLQSKYHCPVLCAGDVFDRWDSRPELINWAIRHLPKMIAIPGQHDLPQHRLDDIRKSAYWTMVEAGVIETLPAVPVQMVTGPEHNCRIVLYGFPWGYPIRQPKKTLDGDLHIALAHQYRWIQGHNYPGAPVESRVLMLGKDTDPFDITIFGDNHSGFITTFGHSIIFNCGTLLRRKSDEASYRPQVGLIYSDGGMVPHFLDISQDILDDTRHEPSPQGDLDAEQFMEQLTGLSQTSLDFRDALEHYLTDNKVREDVRQVLIEALSGGKP